MLKCIKNDVMSEYYGYVNPAQCVKTLWLGEGSAAGSLSMSVK